MKRGDVVTVVLQRAFGKPRPAVIVQSDQLSLLSSTMLVCPLTTHQQPESPFRFAVDPGSGNGLRRRSWLLVDELSLVERAKVGSVMGAMEGSKMEEIDRALTLVLGLA